MAVQIGHAVKNGKIRFLSVSQITGFDPEMDGCPRRWWFRYLQGKKEPPTDATMLGVECAKQAEIYLTTGQDVLGPVMRAGKHLLPKPGPDLEVEQPLGDVAKAVQFRELIMYGLADDPKKTQWQVEVHAGLVADGIPLMGAADYRHRRGEYVDERGQLAKEIPGYRVVEVGDQKTTSRINDYSSRNGKIYKGNAKSVEQILNHPQMVGYAVHAANRYPDATHIRLSHNYFQTKNGYAAEKRTGLISVDEARRRWKRVDAVAHEMSIAAGAKVAEEVPVNLRACHSYGKDCPHMPYCDRPAGTVSDLFMIRKGDEKMSGLFSQLQTNGVTATTANGESSWKSEPPAPPTPPALVSDAEYAAAVAAEKAALLRGAVDSQETAPISNTQSILDYGFCNRCGTSVNSMNASLLRDGNVKHMGCAKDLEQKFAGDRPVGSMTTLAATAPMMAGESSLKSDSPPPPIPALPHVASINPVDSPPHDPIAAASPLTAEAIAAITDPQLKKLAEDHAVVHAARAAAEAAADPKKQKKAAAEGARCSGGNVKVTLTRQEGFSRKANCRVCGTERKIKPEAVTFEGDTMSTVFPGHNRVVAEAAPVVPSAPQETAIAPTPPPPPVPMAPPAVQQVELQPPPPPAPTGTAETITAVAVHITSGADVAALRAEVKIVVEKLRAIVENLSSLGAA